MADGMKKYNFDPSSYDFFQGTWNLEGDNVNRYDPYISGYAFIYWTKLPAFFTNAEFPKYFSESFGDSVGSASDLGTFFKYMTMKNFKSFDGLSDIELGSEAITAGFTGNEMYAADGITKGNTEFTLKHQELSGSPIRLMYQYWVDGIRDMDTGIATYQGATSLEYKSSNHTGELLYIVTDPSGGQLSNSIEFAAYFTNVFPTRIPLSHLNYQSGEHGFTEIDIPFKGIMHISDKVNELAYKNIKKIANFRAASAYNHNITESEYNKTFGENKNNLILSSDDEKYL